MTVTEAETSIQEWGDLVENDRVHRKLYTDSQVFAAEMKSPNQVTIGKLGLGPARSSSRVTMMDKLTYCSIGARIAAP